MSNVLFTSSVSAVGGREGRVQSKGGYLNLEVAMPGLHVRSQIRKQPILSNYLLQAMLLVLTVLYK